MTKPKMTLKELKALINLAHPDYEIPALVFVGIRGYYKKTLGNPDANDRGIYDDALFIVFNEKLIPFNANTDPSRFAPCIANLTPGIWDAYKFDLHRGNYLALCQRSGEVTVLRDGKGLDTGMFGINIHKGGYKKTNSAGCQTIHPDQWAQFIKDAQNCAFELNGKNFKDFSYTYILLEN